MKKTRDQKISRYCPFKGTMRLKAAIHVLPTGEILNKQKNKVLLSLIPGSRFFQYFEFKELRKIWPNVRSLLGKFLGPREVV
jgi:hypothetical protein